MLLLLVSALVWRASAAADLPPSFAPGIERPLLPPQGWRSWNWFATGIDQTIMEAQATAMATTPSFASKSLAQLGYTHIGLDDAWQSCTGPDKSFHDAATGAPIVNTARFPSLRNMVAKATALGLSSGFYGDNCQCHQGEIAAGKTHYVQDVALTLKSGFTGTKIDSCGNQRDMAVYAAQFAAANATLLVESCGNGPAGTNPKRDLPPKPAYLEQLRTTAPWSLYRVSVDLGPQFLSCVYNLNRALPFLDATDPLSRPGCWAVSILSSRCGVYGVRCVPRFCAVCVVAVSYSATSFTVCMQCVCGMYEVLERGVCGMYEVCMVHTYREGVQCVRVGVLHIAL